MFEAELQSKLKTIFRLPKVSYNTPSESQEQECLFVQIDTVRTSIKDAREIARVNGKLHVYANHDKLPYGYFSKCIAEAAATDSIKFFFYDFEENSGRFLNLVERSLSFVYFFDGQYDPNVGTITSIALETVE